MHTQAEEIITIQFEKKIEDLLGRKISEFQAIKDQNSKFNRILLQKDLHIQNLQKDIKIKEQRLNQAQKLDSRPQTITLRAAVQQLYDDYIELFPDLSPSQLKKKMLYMENACLSRYTATQGKHLQIYSRLRDDVALAEEKLREGENRWKERQEELQRLLRGRDRYQRLDNSEEKHQIFNRIPEYKLRVQELQKLERFILNRYVQWMSLRSESQTKLIKALGRSIGHAGFQEMVQEMLQFNEELGTSQKQNIYLTKILCSIQKIIKTITPGKLLGKLEPIKSLEEIQFFVKNSRLRRNNPNKKRSLKSRNDITLQP